MTVFLYYYVHNLTYVMYSEKYDKVYIGYTKEFVKERSNDS